jgi:hypothetical protein
MSTKATARPPRSPARVRGWLAGGLVLLLLASGAAFAQRRWRGGGGWRREPPPQAQLPDWEVDREHPQDVFTFVRLRYSSWRRGGWDTDYPDAEKNFSFRLQQLTSLKVANDPVALDITDERLFDYPFAYIVEPGGLELSDDEVAALRRWLLGGGFLMVDDFWGTDEWENFHEQIRRVFPDRQVVDLEVDHPVFRQVFPLKEKPQVPSIAWAHVGHERGDDGREVHYRAIHDDKGRMMVFIGHNTDLGDGWEREGEDTFFFKEYSEKKAYPMGINVIVYAMTH